MFSSLHQNSHCMVEYFIFGCSLNSPLLKRLFSDLSYYSQHASLHLCVQICSQLNLCDVSCSVSLGIILRHKFSNFPRIGFNQSNALLSELGAEGEAKLYRPEKKRERFSDWQRQKWRQILKTNIKDNVECVSNHVCTLFSFLLHYLKFSWNENNKHCKLQ